MEKTKIIYKKCPVCRQICGFCLTNETIAKNEKFICSSCQEESKLSKWTKSSEKEYLDRIRRNLPDRYIKIRSNRE